MKKWGKYKKNPNEDLSTGKKSKSRSRSRSKSVKKTTGKSANVKSEDDAGYDSLGEITDVEKEEILQNYYKKVMTIAQKKQKERQETRDRLYGKNAGCGRKGCTNCAEKKPHSAPRKRDKVVLHLKEAEDDKLMVDEVNSAHQFSLMDASIQADSEDRLDAEMQTMKIDVTSKQGQTSLYGGRSNFQQTSEVSLRSAKVQAFLREKNESSCQTDPQMLKGKSPITKTIRLQTENIKDIYRSDWAHSRIYIHALRSEAEKRGIKTQLADTSDDGNTDDAVSVSKNTYTPNHRTPIREIEQVHAQNA